MRARIAITSTPAAYTHYEKNRNHSFAVGEPRSAHDRRVKFIVKRTGCAESYRILPVSRRALSRGRIQDSPDTASARGSSHAGLPGGSFPHLPRLHRHVQSLAHWLQNWRRDDGSRVAGADGGGSPLLCRPFFFRVRSSYGFKLPGGEHCTDGSRGRNHTSAPQSDRAGLLLANASQQKTRASALQIRTYRSNRHPSCHSQSSPGSVPNSRNDPSCSATS